MEQETKSGFVVMAIPNTGLFLRGDALMSGDGRLYGEVQESMVIHLSFADAEKHREKVISNYRKLGERFSVTIIPVQYREK